MKIKGNQKNGVPIYKNKKRKSVLQAIKEVKSGKGGQRIFLSL